MSYDFVHNARVFSQLIKRDLFELKSKSLSLVVNGTIYICLQSFIFGYLFPLLKAPVSRTLAMMVGQFISTAINFCFFKSLRFSYDLQFTRFIDYHVTLPLSKYWLLTYYVASFALEMITATLPMIVIGSFLIGPLLVGAEPCIPACITAYLLTVIFFSLLIITFCFMIDFEEFSVSIWPRFLRPLLMISASYFSWNIIDQAFPSVSWLFLISPATYCAEGLRAALFGGPNHLPLFVCLGVISAWIVLLTFLLYRMADKRLDLV